jgi:glyoxylase-like metal-dependent hydrolase (beta-lactamase superfamily II)
MRRRGPICAALALVLCGCSSPPRMRAVAAQAVEAMGGTAAVQGVRSVVMRDGAGSRSRLGQGVRSDAPEMPARLSHVIETLDLTDRRAALEYELATSAGFMQHRQEILTGKGDREVGLEKVNDRPLAVMSPSGLFSWGTQNSPAMTLRRNVLTVLRAALDSAANEPVQQKALDGRMYTAGNVSLGGETITVYFDPESKLLTAYEATDTETILGDVRATDRLEDYRDVSGVRLPHKITVRKGGAPYADVQFASASINDAEAMKVFEIPAAAMSDVDHAIGEGPDYSPVALTRIGQGVYFAQAYSHHSLVVEFPSFLAVVEAPYTEAQSKTLGKRLAAQFPGKPLRYAAVTHPHYDHVGGVRGIAAQGATVIVTQAHEPPVRDLLNAPHTNPPDELATRRRTNQITGMLETFADRRVITEGPQSLELYTISGSPHVDPMVLAYVPSSGILFQSDLFFPGTNAGRTPEAVHLLESVRLLALPVKTNAGGHGGMGKFEELVAAVSGRGTN